MDRAAGRARVPLGEPVYDRLVGDREEQGDIGWEQLVQFFRLEERPGEAVEYIAAADPLPLHVIEDDLRDELLGTDLPPQHVFFHLPAELGPFAYLGPQDVPAREMRDPTRAGERKGLSAFAGTRLSEEYDSRYAFFHAAIIPIAPNNLNILFVLQSESRLMYDS